MGFLNGVTVSGLPSVLSFYGFSVCHTTHSGGGGSEGAVGRVRFDSILRVTVPGYMSFRFGLFSSRLWIS